jgi:hypothetical protein
MINISNHYWIVGGSTTEVYSSATNTMVPVADVDYAAWVAAGNTAPAVSDNDDLATVLRAYGSQLPAWLLTSTVVQPTPDTYSKEQLVAYTAEARRKKMEGDIIVNGIRFSTDPLTLGSLNSAYVYTQTDAAALFAWKLPDGSFVTLDKADTDALHAASNRFTQDCFACEDATLSKIETDVATNLETIDAAFAAVPNTFTGLRSAKELNHRHGPKAKPASKKK